jgi:hypothetical protein
MSESEVLSLFTKSTTILTPKEIQKALKIDEKKKVNSVLQKLVMDKKLTRIEEVDGTNPRFELRGKDGVAKRVETSDRPKVEEQDILTYLELAEEDPRARDIATGVIGNDLRSSITAVNSVLYKMEKGGIAERVVVKDDEPHWRLA